MRINHIEELASYLDGADAVVIGASAGLSASAGMEYSGRRFTEYFSDFIAKYHFLDMYSGGFYPFPSAEEYWAYWSRYIWINRYQDIPGPVYTELLDLVQKKDYFVLTTNVDHCFQRSGFDKLRIFYTQGDFGLWQCSEPCHRMTYDNKETVLRMIDEQKGMRVPPSLVPHCPVCGKPMSMNLRCDNTFVEDNGWRQAGRRYRNFIELHRGQRILFLELGVGGHTPVIIKYPFWKMTYENPNAVYACINRDNAFSPPEIAARSVCVDDDIRNALAQIKNSKARLDLANDFSCIPRKRLKNSR